MRSRPGQAVRSRSNAAWIASVKPPSWAGSRAPSALEGTVTMLSQLTTLAASRPFAEPTGTSVDRPRAFVVSVPPSPASGGAEPAHGSARAPAEPYPAPRYGSGGLLEIERGGDDVLREAVHIGVVASAGQDGHIAGRHDSPALTLQRPGDDSGTALGPAFRYQSVDERDDLAGSRTAICLLIPRWYRIGIASSAEGRRRTGA